MPPRKVRTFTQKFSSFHDLEVVEPESKSRPDAIDMGFRNPRLPGVFGVGVTKGNVNARNFFVLQNIANDAGAGGIRPDRKLPDAIAVLVGAGVGAKFFEQLFVFALELADPIVLHLDRERRLLDVAILLAVIAHHAVDDETPLELAGEVKISPPAGCPICRA